MKKSCLTKVLLLGLAVFVIVESVERSDPFYNRGTEEFARRGMLYKLRAVVKEFRDDFGRDPESLADLCRNFHAPDWPLEYKQRLFWPRWSVKYIGEMPEGWNPDLDVDSEKSPFLISSDPANPYLIEANPSVATWWWGLHYAIRRSDITLEKIFTYSTCESSTQRTEDFAHR